MDSCDAYTTSDIYDEDKLHTAARNCPAATGRGRCGGRAEVRGEASSRQSTGASNIAGSGWLSLTSWDAHENNL